MTDQTIRGVPVLDVTSSGCTPDGRYIWLHFKLPQGNEHNFFIDVAHVDKTISMMREAAGQAYDLQASPVTGAGEGDAVITPMPVKTISIATSPRHQGVIVQATGRDDVPMALLVPLEIARQLAAQLPGVVEAIAKILPFNPSSKLH